MTAEVTLREVSVSQVDLDEASLELVAGADLERLRLSLQEVGLLNPPWLRPQAGRQPWRVVTGSRRLKSAADLNWPTIWARVLPENTADFYCLLVHLTDNAYTRGFNLWEQATLAARLLGFCGQEKVVSTYLPYLGLPPSAAHLDRLLKVATLEAPWPRLAAAGRLALTAAARLAEWTPADREAAWPYLTNLRLSQSKQEEFLEQVALLARREGHSPAAILARDELRLALNSPDRTPQERTEAVRRQLYRWFYPRLSAAREAFEATLGKLGWKGPRRFRLQPPAAFEGPDFHLEIKFQDAPELHKLLQEIADLASQEEFVTLTRR